MTRDILEHPGGRFGMHAGHRIHGRTLERVTEHVGLDRRAERDVEANALLAAGTHDPGEAFAERAVHQRQRAAFHAVAYRHFHEPRRGIRTHEYGARGAREQAELGRDVLEQLLHAPGAMAYHRPDHRLEHVGVNVGWSGEEELVE